MDNGDRAVRQYKELLRMPEGVRVHETSGWRLVGTHVYDPVAETVTFERASDSSDRK